MTNRTTYNVSMTFSGTVQVPEDADVAGYVRDLLGIPDEPEGRGGFVISDVSYKRQR